LDLKNIAFTELSMDETMGKNVASYDFQFFTEIEQGYYGIFQRHDLLTLSA